MLPLLRTFLLTNWTELPIGGPRPRHIEFLAQATGVSKLCCYIFIDDASEPRWVAKMMRAPRDNKVLAREYNIIGYLRQYGSDFVKATVPGPLATAYIAEHLVGIEPYLPGQAMDGGLCNEKRPLKVGLRDYLDTAVNWLLRGQKETPTCHARLTELQLRSYFLKPIARLQQVARLTRAEQRYLERLHRRIRDMADLPLALGFNHGDFQLGNILLNGGSIKVIDWEFGAITGLPLMDVFSFLARIHARCHGLEEIDGHLDDYLNAFENVFFDGGSFATYTAEYVARAAHELCIDPAWTSVLFPMFLINEANKYYDFLRQRAQRGYVYLMQGEPAKIGNSYVDQLARQKNVWLLGHLAENEDRIAFRS